MSRRMRERAVVGLCLLLSGLAVGVYLWYTAAVGGTLGFPLDDAWIHQTYARNLARYGQFAYFPGQPSAGSTSPLWSLLLGGGYLLGVDFRLWAYALGWLALALTGWMVYRLERRLFPDVRWAAPTAGIFCVLEWHTVWAASSGMETALFIFLAMALLERASSLLEGAETWRGWLSAGVLGGLLTLTRPEGLVLLGLVGLAAVVLGSGGSAWALQVRRGAFIACGAALLVGPYVAWHLSLTGLPFPNTFYAKQQEYLAVIAAISFPVRWARVALPPLVGAQLLLLPGASLAVYRFVRGRRWAALLPGLWGVVFLTLYAWRLPVTYQHGRYLMPVIPVLLLYGVGGTLKYAAASSGFLTRVLGRTVVVATLSLLVAFVGIGARAYADDVGFIEGEMVQIASWLRDNTPPDALIAVHDIGAVGYFANRPLLDLAGLVTPEVIPFISDEERLLAFMQRRGASYVVFFPDWSAAYRRMSQDSRLQPVYSTGYSWTQEQGRENMNVYALRSNRGSDRETWP
jgi:hypothetical protein